MAKHRTNFAQQMLAVRRVASQQDDPALWDALHTLEEINRVADELKNPEPDVDRVSSPLERLFVGS